MKVINIIKYTIGLPFGVMGTLLVLFLGYPLTLILELCGDGDFAFATKFASDTIKKIWRPL